MKKNNILFATCLLGAFAFSSCEKNLYDESKQSEKEIKMTDLNIPEDFQWNLTQVSKGTTIANTQTKVSLFLDEKCSKDEKVATIPVYNKAINLPLSLPTYVKTIYAQYQSKSGKMITKSVAVNANGSYTLNIPDAIEAIPTRAITRDNNKKDDDYNTFSIDNRMDGIYILYVTSTSISIIWSIRKNYKCNYQYANNRRYIKTYTNIINR